MKTNWNSEYEWVSCTIWGFSGVSIETEMCRCWWATVRRESKKQADVERHRMSANSVLQRLLFGILSPVLTVSSATHTHPLSYPSFLSSIPSFIYLFICLSFSPVMLSFTRLPSHPPPLFSSSSSSLLCQSLSLPPSITPFSAVMPLFLRPSLLLFIHHRSLPPSRHSSLPPADYAWCDEDWLRNSQREETAGRGWNEERAVTSGEAWGRTGQRNERNQKRKWVKKTTWAIERLRERTADMHCDTLAFIENNAAPITMQIIICKAHGEKLPEAWVLFQTCDLTEVGVWYVSFLQLCLRLV